jgi:hypothetical protein
MCSYANAVGKSTYVFPVIYIIFVLRISSCCLFTLLTTQQPEPSNRTRVSKMKILLNLLTGFSNGLAVLGSVALVPEEPSVDESHRYDREFPTIPTNG